MAPPFDSDRSEKLLAAKAISLPRRPLSPIDYTLPGSAALGQANYVRVLVELGRHAGQRFHILQLSLDLPRARLGRFDGIRHRLELRLGAREHVDESCEL